MAKEKTPASLKARLRRVFERASFVRSIQEGIRPFLNKHGFEEGAESALAPVEVSVRGFTFMFQSDTSGLGEHDLRVSYHPGIVMRPWSLVLHLHWKAGLGTAHVFDAAPEWQEVLQKLMDITPEPIFASAIEPVESEFVETMEEALGF